MVICLAFVVALLWEEFEETVGHEPNLCTQKSYFGRSSVGLDAQ